MCDSIAKILGQIRADKGVDTFFGEVLLLGISGALHRFQTFELFTEALESGLLFLAQKLCGLQSTTFDGGDGRCDELQVCVESDLVEDLRRFALGRRDGRLEALDL